MARRNPNKVDVSQALGLGVDEEGNKDLASIEVLPKKKREPKFVSLVTDPISGEQQALPDTSHLQNRPLRGIYSEDGRTLRGALDINCEATHAGGHGHSGPATHFVTADGESDEQATPVCAAHLSKIQEHAYTHGKNIDVRPIQDSDVQSYKLLSATRNLEIRTAMEGHLLSKGATGQEALVGRTREALGASGKSYDATSEALSRRSPEEQTTALEAALERARMGEGGRAPKKESSVEKPKRKRSNFFDKYHQQVTAEQRSRGGRKRTRTKLERGVGQEPLGEGTGLVDAGFREYVLGTGTDADRAALEASTTEEHNTVIDSINSAREREEKGIPQEGIRPRGFSKGTYQIVDKIPTEEADITIHTFPMSKAYSVPVQIKPVEERGAKVTSELERIAEKQSAEADVQERQAQAVNKIRAIEHFKTGHGEARKDSEQ